MTKEQAQLILQFMTRVQLTGAEVPAFNNAVSSLQTTMNETEKDG